VLGDIKMKKRKELKRYRIIQTILATDIADLYKNISHAEILAVELDEELKEHVNRFGFYNE
jgi:hypothetical protein